MKRTIAATALLVSLLGVTAASAQNVRDYWNYRFGYGQCVQDEGYGRFSTCDKSSGGF